MLKKLASEFIGTFWLVYCGCGSAIFAAQFGGEGNPLGIGLLGVSFAFGLAVLTGAYAFGHISGAHFNPAVSLGLWLGGRFPGRMVLPYMIVQVAGAICAGYLLTTVVGGLSGYLVDPYQPGAFASNGYGAMSPGGYSLEAAFLTEMLLTGLFVLIILQATDERAPAGFAPIAIGLALALIHLVSIPVTNTSVNPARSTGVALFAHYAAIQQLWLFWLAPLLGAAAAGALHSLLDWKSQERW